MKALIDKYYTFTLVFIALLVAMVMFKSNENIVNMVIGAFIGILAVPTVEKAKEMIK